MAAEFDAAVGQELVTKVLHVCNNGINESMQELYHVISPLADSSEDVARLCEAQRNLVAEYNNNIVPEVDRYRQLLGEYCAQSEKLKKLLDSADTSSAKMEAESVDTGIFDAMGDL